MAGSRRDGLGIAGLIIALLALITGVYFGLASMNHAGSSNPAGGGIALAYRHTWSGQLNLPLRMSVQLSLTLGSGGVGEDIGSISSSTFHCGAKVYLENTGSPVALKLVAFQALSPCKLVSLLDSVRVALISGDELNFSVTVARMSTGCDLYD
jgi:hypothetical protein